jgi:hypothetical protein
MLAKFALLAVAILSANAATLPQLESRQDIAQTFVTFWRKGCGIDPCDSDLGCQRTIPFGGQSPTKEGECYANPDQSYRSLQLEVLDDTKWEIDVFSGDGCNNFITVSFLLDIDSTLHQADCVP